MARESDVLADTLQDRLKNLEIRPETPRMSNFPHPTAPDRVNRAPANVSDPTKERINSYAFSEPLV